jgi:hypothetical protein
MSTLSTDMLIFATAAMTSEFTDDEPIRVSWAGERMLRLLFLKRKRKIDN